MLQFKDESLLELYPNTTKLGKYLKKGVLLLFIAALVAGLSALAYMLP